MELSEHVRRKWQVRHHAALAVENLERFAVAVDLRHPAAGLTHELPNHGRVSRQNRCTDDLEIKQIRIITLRAVALCIPGSSSW